MLVHHVNCGSMAAPGLPLVCHVLVVEAPHGLVLVDAGFGQADIDEPGRRLGPARHVLRPALDPAETAVARLRALGLDPADVRDIVLTHLDLDHVGGIADFPDARIHTTAAEALGAIHEPSMRERFRYRPVQWSHRPHLVEHEADGEPWRGFAAARPIAEAGDAVVLLPMPGHTRGHAAVAVDAGDRWIVHAGDAFYHRGTVGSERVPRRVRALEAAAAFDVGALRANQERLAELAAGDDPALQVICAHDPVLLAQVAAT